jgi:HTH-type transcriptional regulator / antitoxin HipB
MRQLITNPGQVGQIINGRRKALHLTQRAVAEKLGISQGRYSTLEDNPDRWTLDRLIIIAKLLGLELAIQDKPSATKPKSEW